MSVRVPHFHTALLLSQLGDKSFTNHQAFEWSFQTPLIAVIMIITFIYKTLITSWCKVFSKQAPLFNDAYYTWES